LAKFPAFSLRSREFVRREPFASDCTIRHTVWHVFLLFGEVMKSACVARFTRDGGTRECHRPRLSAKIPQNSLFAISVVPSASRPTSRGNPGRTQPGRVKAARPA